MSNKSQVEYIDKIKLLCNEGKSEIAYDLTYQWVKTGALTKRSFMSITKWIEETLIANRG